MKGVIMAGGKGTRLRPLTCNLPKPMVPLLHKPVMEYSIELLKKHGITQIAVTTGYLGNHIRNYFGNGKKWGVSLTYFDEADPLGTAGSIKHAETFLDEPFVVISGDAVTDFNLTEGIDYHLSKDGLVTIFMKEVSNPLDYGLIMTHEDGRVRRFIEKPKWDEVYSDYVNTGIYIIDPRVFPQIPRNKSFDFSNDLFPRLIDQNTNNIYGYLATGYWSDIGSLEQYQQTHFDLLNKQANVDFRPKEIAPNIWIGKNVTIEKGVTLNAPLAIGDHTIIKEGAVIESHSVIGAHCFISQNTVLDRAILWDDILIGSNTEVFGSTIASGSDILSSVSLQEHVVIGSQCKIQNKAIVKPTMKIWPNKIIKENAVVNSSVVWGKEVDSALFGNRGITGLPNVDITSDFAIKLARAYAATISQYDDVLIGCDHHPFSKLIVDVLSNGIHSAGISTRNCPEIISPIFRYFTSVENVQGGVFVSMDAKYVVTIEFYNEKGKPIDNLHERRIESLFRYEDYSRVPFDQIGSMKEVSNPVNLYTGEILNRVKVNLIKERCFRIILFIPENLQTIAKEIFENCNCELLFLPTLLSIQEMGTYIVSTNSDFGISIDQSGETFELIDDQGHYYSEEQQLSLFVLISFLTKKQTSISIPVQSSSKIELLASKLNGVVIRTKDHVRDQLNEIEPIFHFRYDAFYALTQMLEVLAIQNTSLSFIMKAVPNMYLQTRHVSCPWDAKGRVMRMLMEETKEMAVDLLEGIKVYHPNGGWTLILPDLEKPIFTIYSQGPNQRLARKTLNYFIKKIRQFQNA